MPYSFRDVVTIPISAASRHRRFAMIIHGPAERERNARAYNH